ncbi:uncharacterized protein [Haliotis asinina]|uniref:uncharacterized protein n=1 Tax=Haliotis asinina TaxID=109174 RepID=UPI003531E124
MSFKEGIRRLHGDVAIQTINSLTRLEKKHILSSNHLTFLMRCRDQQVIPRGLELRSPIQSAAAKTIIQQASKPLLAEPIRHHRKMKAITITSIHEQQSTLSAYLSPELFPTVRTAQTTANNKLDASTKSVHIEKFQQITSSTIYGKKKPSPTMKTVVNLSKKQLTPQQTDIMPKDSNLPPPHSRSTQICLSPT